MSNSQGTDCLRSGTELSGEYNTPSPAAAAINNFIPFPPGPNQESSPRSKRTKPLNKTELARLKIQNKRVCSPISEFVNVSCRHH